MTTGTHTNRLELVVFAGLQASGKSTFFRTYFATTHALVSKDLFRNNRNPNRRQTHLIEAALSAGRSVVVDNTNPTTADREPLTRLGRVYGAIIIGYFFETEVPACLARNRQREGKARVPDVAIYATAKKLVRPSYEEGFDQLFGVSISGPSTFAVEPWPAV